MNPLLRENRQHLFGTGFPVITFSKPAGIEEVAVQLPVLTLGDESLSERAGDLRQGVLDFFKRGSLPQLGCRGANFVKKLPVRIDGSGYQVRDREVDPLRLREYQRL